VSANTPLHILHLVVSSTFAGVERQVVDLTGALGELGHGVTLCGHPDHFAGRVDERRVRFVPARSVREAVAVLVRHRREFDVVHVHMTAAELAASLTAGRRAPVVATRHFAARRGSTIGGRLAAPMLRRRLRSQISISEYVASCIGEPSVVIPNGVTIPAQAAASAKVVLVTQRLDTEKHTEAAFDAWERSRLAGEGWVLRIAGDGAQRPALEADVRARGLPGVEFVGHVQDMHALRRDAGVVLATAPREPFGLAVVEAMAAGLPVVATRAGGHLETVGATRPDLLYEPGDSAGCASLLRRLARDAGERRRVGRELRADAQQRFDMGRNVAAVVDVYRNVTGTRDHTGGTRSLRVLRVFHGGVVSSWRQRERELGKLGCDVRLVSATRWNEGGRDVRLEPGEDDFVTGARTVGRHPYVFVYEPIPIVRALRRGPIDVLDLHEEPASLAALELRILRRLLQPRARLLFYGAQNIEKRYPIPFRWIERGSLRAAAGAYCCSEDAAAIFTSKGLGGEVRTIGLGVDVDRFARSARDTRDTHDDTDVSRPFRLGYVGRIETRKGVGVLVEAMHGLDGVELELYGDGPELPALTARAECLGLAGPVTFCGFTPETSLPEVYARFDAVAVPSLRTPSWVEQFGRVAVEAMAAGVPVLASDDGSLRDVIGDAGLLVPAGDVEAWHKAIHAVATDADLRAALRESGLARARHYTWAAVARAQLNLYEAVAR
jgi:glycosyltransferase involved in cell wall biosynthesis